MKPSFLRALCVLLLPVLASAADSMAPDLAFTDLLQAPEGAKVDWPSLRGKVVLVNFWATWCVPCVAEFPLLNDLMKASDPAKVQLIAANYNGEKREKIAAFLKSHPLSAWIGLDSKRRMQKLYGVNAIPVTFIIGPDGRVIHRMEYPETLTAEQLTALTEGKPVTFDGTAKANAAQLDEQKKQAAEAEKAKIASLRATDGKTLATIGANIVLAEAASAPDDGLPADVARTAMWEPGRYNLVDGRLQDLIANAFRVQATRVALSGISSDKRYNLHVDMKGAKPEAIRDAIEQAVAKGLGVKAIPQILEEQVLLLVATPETANHLDQGPLPSQRYCFFNPVPPDKAVSCVAGSFDELASAIEDAVQTPVLNETNLSGTVTATLPALSPDRDSLAGPLADNLGLALTPAKRSVKIVVVSAFRQ